MNARHIHVVIAVFWVGLAGVIGIGLAWLGNEEQLIARQRGEDHRRLNELQYRHEHLVAEIEWLSGKHVYGRWFEN